MLYTEEKINSENGLKQFIFWIYVCVCDASKVNQI